MGWLAASPPMFRQALFDGASLQKIAAGAYLYHIEDDADGLWGLESGSVAVEYAHPSGLLKPACVLHRGHWGGEGPILDGRKRSVGIRALQDCMFCRVPLSRVRRLLAANPQYWREIGRLALEHYDLTAGIAADGMIPDSRRRLVAVLMRLAGLRDPYPPETGEIHLSKSEIASIVNLSRSSLTPLLIDLQAKGVIELGYRRIRVPVPARLLSNSLASDDSP